MKFSDALRSAADRAPVDDVKVSATVTAGRIKRERAWRMGGNALMGASAVALVAVAVGPLATSADESAEIEAAMMSSDQAASDMATEGVAPELGGRDGFLQSASPWVCGSDFDPTDGTWAWGDSSGVTYTVDAPQFDRDEILLPNTLEAQRPVALVSSPDYVITWDGMVVGSMVYPESMQYGPADDPILNEGQVFEQLEPGTDLATLEQWTSLDPVNCWDGEALPPGDYQVHQAWSLAYVEAATALDEPVLDEPTSAMPQTLEPFRVAVEPVDLTLPGEPVDDPFAAYLTGDGPAEPMPLPEPIEPLPTDPLPVQPIPDGTLTPDQARELFEANTVNGPWDMAAGSQRWVITHDSQAGHDDAQWQRNHFGCAWGDEASATFPTRAAQLDLLDVDVNIPARINVSYGFVVDGNPKVTATITNSSDFTLPGLWSGAQPQLYLVRDGVVMATASPQSIDRSGVVGILDGPAVMHQDSARAIAPVVNGALEPGASLGGDYLWRDVSGCGTAQAPLDVPAGTYTVLAVNSVSVSNQQLVSGIGVPEPAIHFDDSTPGDGLLRLVEPDMQVLPAPAEWDSVELQGWTSLGTVTVTRR